MEELHSFDGDTPTSHPTVQAGAAPPRPPAPFYGTPPNYGGWSGPGWGGSPGAGTLDAVRELKKSIRYYQIYLVLGILATLVAVGLLDSVVVGSAGSLLSPTGTGRSVSPTGVTGTYLAAIAVLAIIGLASFILLLLAWITWLGGSNKLAQHAGEFGPQAAASARSARTDWTLTTVVFFVNILVAIVLAAVLIVAVVSSFGPLANRTATSSPAPINLSQFIGYIIVTAVISAVLAFLLYWFSTRGLVGGLGAIASQEIRSEAETARTIILVGAVLSFAGAGGYLVPIVGLAALLSPIVLLYGFWRLGGAYDRWLARPPTPSLPLPYAPVSARPYG